MDIANISEWTRVDNLSFWLNNEFEYIREEAELINYTDGDEFDIYEKVHELFMKDYPQFFKVLDYDKVIDIEIHPFENDPYDDNSFPGFACYIHFHKDLVTKLYNHIIDNHPDYVLKYLHWLEQPLKG